MPIAFVGTEPDYRNRSDKSSHVALSAATGGVKDKGVATLVAGVATVTSASASAANTVLLTYYSVDGSVSSVAYSTIVEGVSFVIKSGSSNDTNKVSWAIV